MHLLLIQDAVYLPSYGGGNKSNRLLMTELAARGHECTVMCKGTTAGLRQRFDGVNVETLDLTSDRLVGIIGEAIRRLEPDWVVVSDDKLHVLLEAALQAAPDRVVLAVHTHMHLPFGPEGRRQNAQQLERFRQARSIIAASDYVRDHLQRHAGLPSTVLRFPVYGQGPFDGPPERGFVTMVNPCLIKGLPIFLALA